VFCSHTAAFDGIPHFLHDKNYLESVATRSMVFRSMPLLN